MNKILVGVIVGAICGFIDGTTAWFTPQVRDQILMIVFLSTIKGVIAGVAAGFFARKVKSVPLGVAFGFAVGLVLAYLVAMSPDPNTGEHYWWQIMVPGSILGGVIGWATQRYGKPAATSARSAVAATLFALLTIAGVDVNAKENAAFARLAALAGTHDAKMNKPDGEPTRVEYRLTAGGSALEERLFVGEPHEMITLYTADGDSIVATHYCLGNNQPTMRLNVDKSRPDDLVFDLLRVGGNATPNHITGVRFRFSEDGKVESIWSSKDNPEHVRLYFK
jgi:hypothetical protein